MVLGCLCCQSWSEYQCRRNGQKARESPELRPLPPTQRGKRMPDAPTTLATQDAGGSSDAVAQADASNDLSRNADEPSAHLAEEAVYDQAVREFLGSGDGDDASTDPGSGITDDAGAAGGAVSGDTTSANTFEALTADQQQLLKRSHISPEMIEAWSPEQLNEFLGTAGTREGDQTRSYQDLQQQLSDLRAMVDGGGDGTSNGTGRGNDEKPSSNGKPPADLRTAATAAVDKLVDVYGEEMEPLRDVLSAYDQRLDQAQAATGSVPVMQQILVEQTIELGIRDLEGDFPSLAKPDTRKQVVDRFNDDWAKGSHQNGDGPIIQRIRSALHSAAKAELGDLTESAVQASLVGKTKQRLAGQPPSGGGRRSRPKPQTEDEIYSTAFDEHLAKNT